MKTYRMLTEENYPESNWIPVGVAEKCTERRRVVPSNIRLYFDYKMIFLCCRDLSYGRLNWWMCLNILKRFYYLNANNGHWCRLENKGIKEVKKHLSTSNHVWCSCLQSALPPFLSFFLAHPTLHHLPFISWPLIGFANCELTFLPS